MKLLVLNWNCSCLYEHMVHECLCVCVCVDKTHLVPKYLFFKYYFLIKLSRAL